MSRAIFAFAACFLMVSGAQAAIIKLVPDATHTALDRTSTGVYDPLDLYALPGGFGVAFLLPPLPLDVARGGVTGGFIDFKGVLTTEFDGTNGWSFVTAGADLADDSLEITAYDVHGGTDFVGHDGKAGAPNRTRGFAVRVPEDKDPAGSEHWIQVIKDNHNLSPSVHGNVENIVDTGSLTSPYYDDGGAADSRNFFDLARRTDPDASHYWLADLHLVTGPAANAPGEVTIHNGIRYGWANVAFTGVPSLLHGFFHDTVLNSDNLGTELGIDPSELSLDLSGSHSEFHTQLATTVPVPAAVWLFGSALGLLGWMRRKVG